MAYKYLKKDKKYLDYILLKLKREDLIRYPELSNKYDFIKEYHKTDNPSFIIVMSFSMWNRKALYPKFPKIVFPHGFGNYISINLFTYLLLKFTKEINNVTHFINLEFKKDNDKIKCKLHHINKYFKSEFESNKILFFFPALKWFYSEETKYLYSKELLKQMKEYEEEIKNIKWEDCIREPGKYARARF
ncbi:MAG: hypothetical protein U9R34_00135 [Nanoarchaeota archaeon]|nr:hypothetical protein [Nanoarchaeota archaeon]